MGRRQRGTPSVRTAWPCIQMNEVGTMNMMNGTMMNGPMSVGMMIACGVLFHLVLAVLVLGALALVKYLRRPA